MRNNRFLSGRFFCLLLCLTGTTAISAQIQPTGWNSLMAPLPDPLAGSDGKIIGTPLQWETERRGEILELFRDHVYGKVPETGPGISHRVKFLDMEALSGTAVMKEVEVKCAGNKDTLSFTILIFLPAGQSGPVPLFAGLNFYGNHTIHPDPEISISDSWVLNSEELGITGHRATADARGVKAGRWPVELILSRGYGLATVCCGDIDPDFDDGFKNGIHGVMDDAGTRRDSSSWGTLAAWAWGLSRCMDYFETDPDIDAGRVAVVGHSRLGKTALWAGAQDERFALVISNNSGCGGAALSRRDFGESVPAINEEFPHWFADRFKKYNEDVPALPVDQHMLLALMAPRPLYVASASEDDWADPCGEYLSLYYGSRVYGLYGQKVLENRELPPVDRPVVSGRLGYHIRTGKHDITRYDWERYLDFADQQLRQGPAGEPGPEVTMEWIRDHFRSGNPRLILTPELDAAFRRKLKAGDPLAVNGFRMLQSSADKLLEAEPLAFRKTGRRLLGVSREAVRRLTTLAMVYRYEKDGKYLERLEQELRAVCSFGHWNPDHFLDVAEMAAGVSLALDWAGEWISPEVEQLARRSLVDKALKPGIAASEYNWWTDVHHNWNLVCHGGLSLAALTVFGDEPEIASRVLRQAVEKIPLGLQPYAPSGIYPEGPSYWFYATTYLTAAISAFESSLGTDFGFSHAPGVMESAAFSMVLAGPGGDYYNYFDAGLEGFGSLSHCGLLAWFAARSGNGPVPGPSLELIERDLSDPRQVRGTQFFPVLLLNFSKLEKKDASSFINPEGWVAPGEEPLGIFRDAVNERDAFFLAAKGGMAADNHGNMDAGSFILELDGVRWSVDPGNQDYYQLEQIMGQGLWETGQDSPRWTLLTKNNFGHSTITVNGNLHRVDGRALLVRWDLRNTTPEFTFDLSPVFGEDLRSARRTFQRISENRLIIRDELVASPATEKVAWQLVTQAEVSVLENKVLLQQDGKKLYIHLHDGSPGKWKVISLLPPPLRYDKMIPGLKRIELTLDRESLSESGGIVVELTNEPEIVQSLPQ